MTASRPATAAPAKAAPAAPAAPASGGRANPQDEYNNVFGAEEKKVLASSGTKDDAQFAASLLEKAKALTDDPALVQFIYNKAYEMGIRDPDGYATAGEALKLMGAGGDKSLFTDDLRAKQIELYKLEAKRGTPAQKAEATEALLDALVADAEHQAEARQYAEAGKKYREALSFATSVRSGRAAVITMALKDLQAKQLLIDKVDKLKAKLDAQPGDKATLTQLLDVYLTELDDPAGAAKVVNTSSDDNLRRMVQLAAKDSKVLSEDEHLALGA